MLQLDKEELPAEQWTSEYIQKRLSHWNKDQLAKYKKLVQDSVMDGKIDAKAYKLPKRNYIDFNIPDGEDNDDYLPQTTDLVNKTFVDERKTFATKKAFFKPVKYRQLKKSIVPGVVVIVVAGKYKAQRCIFLKQLDNHKLLLASPYKNVPLIAIGQEYVIGTRTVLDISSVEVPAKIDGKYFRQRAEVIAKTDVQDIFEEKPEEEKARNKDYWTDVLMLRKQLKKVVRGHKEASTMKRYLKAAFTVPQKPIHQVKF